jgi:type II secretory pathway component PulF
LIHAKTDILDGCNVCTSFEKYKIIDGGQCDLIAIGEKIGDLSSSLKDIHKMYNGKLQFTLRILTMTEVSELQAVSI